MTIDYLPSYTVIHSKTSCFTFESTILSGVKDAFNEGKTTCFTFIDYFSFMR